MLGGVVLLQLGCDDGKVKACHSAMEKSQASLLAMDNQSRVDVEGALGDIEAALAACKAAKRETETNDVLDAKRTLTAHLTALDKRAAEPQREKATPEELLQLEKAGDPGCPSGQAYQNPNTKKTIRCTGKALASMSWDAASEHLAKRGFTIAVNEQADPRIIAELGAERYVFTFASGERSLARCVEATGRPGVPWEEVATRLTSVPMNKLDSGGKIVLGGVERALRVEGDAAQWTVFVGDCASPSVDGAAPAAVATSAPSAAPATSAPAAP